jgi:glycerate kinase
MLTFVLAPDSFKESMTATEACVAMEVGIKKVFPSAHCIHSPMADGGEGTVETLVNATKGSLHFCDVIAPLGNTVTASYGILGDGSTAVIEMASASGIHLVPFDQRNPLITTTFGTGQLIRQVIEKHQVKRIIIGIGGSATNDAGVGMAQALGVKFLDEYDTEIPFGGGNLHLISNIDDSQSILIKNKVEIEVACDVANPLCGSSGASFTYGKQKGANEEMMILLDKNLAHFAQKVKTIIGKDVENIPGAGAAGGLGAGLIAFSSCTLSKGVDLVIKHTHLEEKIKEADFVFTGEGSIDNQTQFGKVPMGVAQLAKKYQKPTIAFAGKIGDVSQLYDKGIDSIFCIVDSIITLENALKYGKSNLEKTTERVSRLINITNF